MLWTGKGSTGWSRELLAAAVDTVDVLDGSGSGVGSAEGSSAGSGTGTGSGAGSWLCVGVASISTGNKQSNKIFNYQNKTKPIASDRRL